MCSSDLRPATGLRESTAPSMPQVAPMGSRLPARQSCIGMCMKRTKRTLMGRSLLMVGLLPALGGMIARYLSLRQANILFTSSNGRDRKSTRLNSSHVVISYAVFCLKKKTNLIN